METSHLMCGVCPSCGAMVLGADEPREREHGATVWLSCSRCDRQFTSREEELLFKAVPLSWFSMGNA